MHFLRSGLAFAGSGGQFQGQALQSLMYRAIFVIHSYTLIPIHGFRKTLSHRISIERISGFGLLGIGLVLIFKGYKALPTP